MPVLTDSYEVVSSCLLSTKRFRKIRLERNWNSMNINCKGPQTSIPQNEGSKENLINKKY